MRTVFQAIALHDTLTIEESDADAVEFDIEGIPAVNTVTRALERLRAVASFPLLRVRVQKQVPSESGLGGGSSDAAGLIRAIAIRWLPDFPVDKLMEIALAVGADVPFFLVGGRARAEGYGERLVALPDSPDRHLVLLRPNVGASTPEMFRQLDQARYEWREFPAADSLYNDFERVAPCDCLDLIERLLAHGADDAGLTGSGSVVFGRFPDHSSAETAATLLKVPSGPSVWLTRTITREESLQLAVIG